MKNKELLNICYKFFYKYITINDLIVAGTKIIYSFEEIRKHDETIKRLDDFLKNS